MRHLQHDTKALMQNTAPKTNELTADYLVDNIKNDWCKNYVNNAILEDLKIRRISTSKNLLFPIDIYRKCRTQLIAYDEQYEELYFTTRQLDTGAIEIEKNALFTKVIDVLTNETIAQFNTKKTKNQEKVCNVA